MRRDEVSAVERFAARLHVTIDELELYSSYMKLSPEKLRLRDSAISILKEKLHKLEKAKGRSDIKEVVKIKSLMESMDV